MKNFREGVKVAPWKEEFVVRTKPCKGRRDAKANVKQPGVQQTMADVYDDILLTLQNSRQWADSTCKAYDRIAWNIVLPAFSDIEFAAIDEHELIMRWHTINNARHKESIKNRCYFLIRAIFDTAYELGYTKLTMWGLPERLESRDDQYGSTESYENEENDVAKALTEHGVKIQATMPLKTILALTREAIQDCTEHGELMGLLIMISAGARTSESLAAKYKDLTEYKPGKWALAIYSTQEKGRRVAKNSGKTSNAPRWVPVPSFFAKIVLNRKTYISKTVPNVDVNSLEIACVQRDYTRGVTSAELNLFAKELYQRVGGSETLWAEAMTVLLEERDEAQENEGSATAYLLRHQFSTALVACGITEAEVQALMGHKIESKDIRKYDLANPDVLEKLAKKMEQRGLVQILDGRSRVEHIVCDNRGAEAFTQGDVTLHFEGGGEYQIKVTAREAGRPLSFELHDGQLLEVRDTAALMEEPHKFVYMRNEIFDRAMAAWGDILAADLSVPKPKPAISDMEWLQGRLMSPAVKPVVIVASEPEPKDAAPVPEQHARLEHDTWVITDQNKVVELSCQEMLVSNRLAVRGEVVIPESCIGCRIKNVIMHNPTRPAYIICDNGMAYYVPPGRTPDQFDVAILDGATWVPIPETEHALTLVCLSKQGGVVRYGVEVLCRITEAGVQLVALNKGDSIVSACLCTTKDDLLLVSAKGRALRLEGRSLELRKTLGCQMIRGLGLKGDDRAVHCSVYEPSETYLVGVDTGKIARIDAGDDLMRHGRGTTGRAYVRGSHKDYVTTVTCYRPYIMLLSDSGRAMCIDAAALSPHNMGSMGIRALKVKDNEQLAAILPAELMLYD